jgi:hypothetical protein
MISVFTLITAMFMFMLSLLPKMTPAQVRQLVGFQKQISKLEQEIRNTRSKLRVAEPGRPHITVSVNGKNTNVNLNSWANNKSKYRWNFERRTYVLKNNNNKL